MQLAWTIDDYLIRCFEEAGEFKLRVGWAYEDGEDSGEDVSHKDAQVFMQFFSYAFQDAKLQKLIAQPDADDDVETAFLDYAYENRLDCWLNDVTVTNGCAACGKDFTGVCYS